MAREVRMFWLPKAGHSPAEYEDARAWNAPATRFAIADGAAESSFAGGWAQALVQRYVTTPPPQVPSALCQWLGPIQRRWHAAIAWERLPWYAVAKAQVGAGAALVGLDLDPPGTWHAIAVGDSCLFHVRGGHLALAFPVERAEAFGNRPVLLSSNPASNTREWQQSKRVAGDTRPGDLFLLATDALAQWFLAQHEAGERPWESLHALTGQWEFARFVTRLRDIGQLRNDDTTVLLVRLLSDTTVVRKGRRCRP